MNHTKDDTRNELKIDEALLNFNNLDNKTFYLWKQFTECYKCPLQLWAKVTEKDQTIPLTISSNYELEYAISNDRELNSTKYCREVHSLRDHSIHNINITANETGGYVCDFETIDEGRNDIWPLVWAVVIYVLAAIAFYVGRRLFYKWRDRRAMSISLPSDPISTSTSTSADDKKRKRLKSLDCFRGITILMMIFVNYGAGDYEFLDHASWDGFNFADIIFPWFIFIMGTTMAISFKSVVIRQKTPVWKIYFNIVKRSAKLFLIGLILNSNRHPDFRTLRIPGVLQRFGISYLVVASTHVLSLLLYKGELFGALRIHQLVDIIPYWPEWVVMFVMSGLYFGLTFGWTFDQNCPKGYVGPGGLYDNASHVNCTGGAAAVIDRWLLGPNHIYKWFTAAHLYDPDGKFGLKHDPEGVLGTTNSIILTFLGLQLGKILIAYPNPRQRITRWLVWGTVLGALCAIFAATDWIPINKNLWSFSFVCLTASSACFALSALYYLIDVWRVWPNGQPFHYPGMNSILLYIGHSMCADMIPWNFNVDDTSHTGPLAKNLVGVTVWFLVSVYLAEKGFFLTV